LFYLAGQQAKMLLFLCLSLARCEGILGIDFGSQFMKMAKSTTDFQLKIVTDPITNSVTHPSAAAIKFRKPVSFPISLDDFDNSEVWTGQRGLPLLKRNASTGIQFLPRGVGRARNTEFHTSQVANVTELLALQFFQMVQKVLPFQSVTVAVPSYFTLGQYFVIGEICRAFSIPVVAIVPDTHAIFNLYGALRVNRFASRPKHVLFVDVGATATKVYSGTFTYINEGPGDEGTIVNQTAGEWTEQVGGYYFAKAIAQEKGISYSKAQKTLLRTQGEGLEDLVEKELSVLEDIIRTVIETAEQKAVIDELQVIGGASNFNFVVQTIKRATNLTIRRDFNSNEAIALGALLTGISMEEASPYLQTGIEMLPMVTLNVTCGNQSQVQQVKGDFSNKLLTFDDLTEACTEFDVVADPETLPVGVNPVIGRYAAKDNVTLSGSGNFTVTLQIDAPHSRVRAVRWCQSSQCQESETELRSLWENDLDGAFAFLRPYLDSIAKRDLRSEIHGLLGRINSLFARILRSNVEATFQPTEEMKQWVAEINALNETDGLESLDGRTLTDIESKLKQVAKVTRLDKERN
jgi:hypothetical protein